MRHFFLLLCTIAALTVSCDRANDQKTISYDDRKNINADTLTMSDIMEDTTKILMASLPIYFDSTRVLISPIGYFDVETRSNIKSRIASYSKSDNSDSYVYNTANRLSGNFTNIYFDDVDNGIQRLLTNKALCISSMNFERKLWLETGKQYVFYHVYDKDNNRDGKIDTEDVESIYISHLNGSDFEKLLPENQQYNDGIWAMWCLRYYFTSSEDSNKDGKFDMKDKMHYFYIDFSSSAYKVTEYNPLGNI